MADPKTAVEEKIDEILDEPMNEVGGEGALEKSSFQSYWEERDKLKKHISKTKTDARQASGLADVNDTLARDQKSISEEKERQRVADLNAASKITNASGPAVPPTKIRQ